MSNLNEEKGTVSEKTINGILDRLMELEVLILGLITSLECDLYANEDIDSDSTIKGGNHFVIDEKAVLATFGQRIWDQISNIHFHLKDLKRPND